jgi:hypothetical protein
MQPFCAFQYEKFSYAQLRRAYFELAKVQKSNGKEFTFGHGIGFNRSERRLKRGAVTVLKQGPIKSISAGAIVFMQTASPGSKSYIVGQFKSFMPGTIHDRIFTTAPDYASSAIMRILFRMHQDGSHPSLNFYPDRSWKAISLH